MFIKPDIYFVLVAALSFVLGSIPFGYLVPKIFKNIDIRKSGSGNPGATNVVRTIGMKYGVAVFILDFLKGMIPAYIGARLSFSTGRYEGFELACGITAVAGHVFTPFLGFKGGKGVATSAGVFAEIAFLPFLSSLAVFGIMFYWTRIVSVSSLLATLVLPLAILLMNGNRAYFWVSCVVAFLIVVRHKKNIIDLMNKSEKKLIK